MPLRPMGPCLAVGCPRRAVYRGRCAEHAADAERARGRRQARGYDAEHDRIVRRLKRTLVPGTPCRRCGEPMYPSQDLDAGHPSDAPARRGGRADQLEHAACNRGKRWGPTP